MKRVISLLLAVVMLSGISVVAYADETEAKTYNYVAFGDSIASGFGLSSESGDLASDPAMMVTEDLIADPVKAAYPAVFGELLNEIGETYGYTTKATNLSATAYRAQDVTRALQNEGFKGEIAEWIFEKFNGEGSSAPLADYHDIFNKYLSEADLVSVQLGGNDVVMAILDPCLSNDNPIMQAVGMAVMLTLFGEDAKTVAGGALMVLSKADEVTVEDAVEAAEYFSSVVKNKESYVVDSAANVKTTVETIQSINSDADVALVGMFNPYGNSLEYKGQVRDLCTVISNIFSASLALAGENCGKYGEVDVIDDEEIEGKNDEFTENVEELSACEKGTERFKALLGIVAEEISYPLQYLAVGKNVDSQITSLNEKLKAIADETGAIYVDVYGIDNECNLDPHPDENGHKQIANIMSYTLSDTILSRMGVEIDPESEQDPVIGDADGDGQITIIDVTIIQCYYANMIDMYLGVRVLDIDCDGSVTVLDATWIQRKIVAMPMPGYINSRFCHHYSPYMYPGYYPVFGYYPGCYPGYFPGC